MNNPFITRIPTNRIIDPNILVPTPSQGSSPFGPPAIPITNAPIFQPRPPSPFEPPPGGFQPPIIPPIVPTVPIGPDRINPIPISNTQSFLMDVGKIVLLTSPAWLSFLIFKK